MGWDIGDILHGIFGANAPQMAPVQPINPGTSAGQPPSLGTPGGSGIGGTPPATGAAPPAAPAGQLPQTMNIPGMGNVALPKQSAFDNPWLQAALSAYFGFAGSPRSRGVGGALSEAGKAGLGAYQQARAQQWAPYKTLAELQKAGAETELVTAQAGKTKIEEQRMAGTLQHNQTLAAALGEHAKSLPDGPEKDAELFQVKLLSTDDQKPYTMDEVQAGIKSAADTFRSRSAGQLSLENINVAKAREQDFAAKQGLYASEEGRNFAQQALANANAQYIKTQKPMTTAQRQALLLRARDIAEKNVPAGWTAAGTAAAKKKAGDDAVAQLSQQLDAQDAQFRSNVNLTKPPADTTTAGLNEGETVEPMDSDSGG